MRDFGLALLLLLAGALILMPSGCALVALSYSPHIAGEDIALIAGLSLPPIVGGLFLGRWAMRKLGERAE
jgi:hypothetical protein